MADRIEITAVWPTKNQADAKRLLDEIGPLLEAHWMEVRTDPSWTFNLDVESFIIAWQSRALVPVIGRIGGQAVGCILLSVGPMLMSAPRKEAVAMSVYLKPEFRGGHFEHQTMEYLRNLSGALGVTRMTAVRQRAVTVLYKE